jgi:hypothetical protein
MYSFGKKLALTFALSGLFSACTNTIEQIETATHKGYCSEDRTFPLSVEECEKKIQAELYGKPEKSESEKIMDAVNQSMNKKDKLKR